MYWYFVDGREPNHSSTLKYGLVWLVTSEARRHMKVGGRENGMQSLRMSLEFLTAFTGFL